MPDEQIITDEELRSITTLSKVDFYMYILSLSFINYSGELYFNFHFEFSDTFNSLNTLLAKISKEPKINKENLLKLMIETVEPNPEKSASVEKEILNIDVNRDKQQVTTLFGKSIFGFYLNFLKKLIYILPFTEKEKIEIKNRLIEKYVYCFFTNEIFKKYSLSKKVEYILSNIAFVYVHLNILIIPDDTVSLLTKILYTGKISMSKHLHKLIKIEKNLNSKEYSKLSVALFHDLNQTKEYQLIKAKLFLKKNKK